MDEMLGQIDLSQKLGDACRPRGSIENFRMNLPWLGNQSRYILPGMKGGIRILEDHLQILPLAPHFRAGQGEQIGSLVENGTAISLHKTQKRSRERGFAGSGLAH